MRKLIEFYQMFLSFYVFMKKYDKKMIIRVFLLSFIF
jgi:hypothetical protein